MINQDFKKVVVLTQAQFNAKQTAGTLEAGVEYQIIGETLPPCPSTTDGTYVLKATVSSGVVTYAWVLEE